MRPLACILHLLIVVWATNATAISQRECQPFQSTFESYEVTRNPYANAPFRAVSPGGSYNIGGEGLELYLEKPNRPVKTKNGVNDVVAEGATINSTFTLL